uniref:Uncharacterized protein n=1 Tax=Panagrolaimus sp. ES5 TaxID=591445 RepID=A0AC34GCT1_9BILA
MSLGNVEEVKKTVRNLIKKFDYDKRFLVYTVELDPLYFPLPGPPEAATTLEKETLQIFKLWVKKYVGGYPKLENAKTVLLSSKTFDFARSDGQIEVERNRAEADRIRKDIVDKKISDQVLTDFADSKAHVKESIIEAQTTISLI